MLPRRRLVLAAAAGPSGAAVQAAGGGQPTVVELFTSQGCSSCPPANANLASISERPGVLALSFGVTYWDRLGWPDTFAKPEFTARQVAYEPPLHRDGPFTPQMVVDGRADTVGNRLAAVEALIAASRHGDRPMLRIGKADVAIGAGAAPASGADVWLVTYDPRLVDVPVGRGENAGRTLPHKNVVHALERIGAWRGTATDLPLPAAALGLASCRARPGAGRRGDPRGRHRLARASPRVSRNACPTNCRSQPRAAETDRQFDDR